MLEHEVGAAQRALHDVDQRDAGDVVHAHTREAHLEQVGHDLKGHVVAHAVVTNGQDVVVRGGREGDHHLVDVVAGDGLSHAGHRSEVAEAAESFRRAAVLVQEPDQVIALIEPVAQVLHDHLAHGRRAGHHHPPHVPAAPVQLHHEQVRQPAPHPSQHDDQDPGVDEHQARMLVDQVLKEVGDNDGQRHAHGGSAGDGKGLPQPLHPKPLAVDAREHERGRHERAEEDLKLGPALVAHVIRGRDRAPEMILVAQPIRAGKGQIDKDHVKGQGHRREHPAQRQGTTRNTRDRRLGQGHTTSGIGCGAARRQNTRCLKYPMRRVQN